MTTDHHDSLHDGRTERQRFLAEAVDPDTEPQRLLELVGMNDPEIAVAVASHPRISPEVVENLILLFPNEILANPASIEVDRANPGLFQQMFGQESHLLKTARFPAVWQNRLLQDPEPLIRSAIAANPYLETSTMQRCLHSEDRAVRQGLADNSALAAIDLEELSYDPDPLVRWAIAKSQNIYPGILERLAKDAIDTVRVAVASHPRTTASTLLQLSQDPDLVVRQQVAANPHSSQAALAKLVRDPDVTIAENLVKHSHISADLLVNLAQNPAWPIKAAVASNIQTPVATLIDLADLIPSTDAIESFPLRLAIAQNPNSPDFLLSRCLLPEDLPSRREKILLQLSQHLNTPDELLDSLADHENLAIQENIVNHPQLHHPTLVKLAHSKSWPIQQRALERINASPAVIDRQTYIAEAEASLHPSEVASPVASPSTNVQSALSQPFEITLLSAEESFASAPLSLSSSFIVPNTNWGEVTKTGLSHLYDRTGEHLSALHPLALLLAMLTMICLGLGLTLWVKSVPQDPKAIVSTSPSAASSVQPSAVAQNTNSKFVQAIYLANAATIDSQRAVTKEDWRKIVGLWKKAIGLMESVPPSDPKYSDAQGRASNYKNILSVANLKLAKAR